MPLPVFSNHRFAIGLPPGHRFPSPKYELLRDAVALHCPELQVVEAGPASDGELALVHTPDYIAAVVQGSLSTAAQREIGFPWSERMVERSRRSVGATIAAARAALALQGAPGGGVALHLAGGTHHAQADKGSGYCVFNDVAVAARLMQAEAWRLRRLALRVWVIDLDVHQGNGTAAIFANDASVFTLSLHGARNFPFRKEPSDLDVELPDGCTDPDYLQALEQALDTLEQRFAPQLIFYLAGADPHEGDRLGRLAVTHDGLEARDRRVFDWAWQRRIPLVFAMAGGYGRNLDDTVLAQLNTWRVAWQYHQRWQNVRP